MQPEGKRKEVEAPAGFGFDRKDLVACLFIAAFCLALFLPRIGSYGLWDPWEPKYGQSVREMLQKGEIITPYYEGEIRYTKPILVYWAIMAPAKILGLSEFSERLPSGLMALAGCLGLYAAVSRLRSRRAGIMAALILATSPQFFFLARTATPDIYLSAASGAAAAFMMLGLSNRDLRVKALATAYVFMGLAVLAKGPVALISPMAAVGLFLLWQWEPGIEWSGEVRRAILRFLPLAAALLALGAFFAGTTLLAGAPTWWWYDKLPPALQALRDAVLGITGRVTLDAGDRMPGVCIGIGIALSVLCFALCGLGVVRMLRPRGLGVLRGQVYETAEQVLVFVLISLLVAGPWYFAVIVKHGGYWIEEFIGKHNIHRASVEVSERGGGSEFYLRAGFFAIFPWVVLVPAGVAFLGGSLRRSLPPERRAPGALALLWLLMLFMLYTYSTTKFFHYIAPALPVAAVVLALGLERLLAEASGAEARGLLGAGLALFAVSAVFIARQDLRLIVNMFTVKLAIPRGVQNTSLLLCLFAVFGLSVVALASGRARGRLRAGAAAALFASAFAFSAYCTWEFMPKLAVHKTLKPLADVYGKERKEGEELALFGQTKHSLIYYTDNRAVLLGTDLPKLVSFMAGPKRAFCVVQRRDIASVRSALERKGISVHTLASPHFDYLLISNAG